MQKVQDIYTFLPLLKSTIWGGERILRYKGIQSRLNTIGESWEISDMPGSQSVVECGPDAGMTLSALVAQYGQALVGEKSFGRFGARFPLLIKFIDTRHDLSVQVHPDDEIAMRRHGSLGKSEMWYVIDAEEGAKIHIGFKHRLTPDEYQRMVSDKTIMDAVASYDVRPGDVFYLPAGRIHSIGAGILLAEVQDSSDITYRIFDFDRRDASGNLRQLHTEEAAEAIDFSTLSDYRHDYDRMAADPALVGCSHFNVRRIDVGEDIGSHDFKPCGEFVILMCVSGSVMLKPQSAEQPSVLLSCGHSVLVAASAAQPNLDGEGILLAVTL